MFAAAALIRKDMNFSGALNIMVFFQNLKLRWKLLVMVLPLVVVPILLVGGVIGFISTRQAFQGITQASKADLEHMSSFTLNLLDAHYQQYQVYKLDKVATVRRNLGNLVNLAYSLVETQHKQYADGHQDIDGAKVEASRALKKVSVGETGYIYAMNSSGGLEVHIASEGENVYDAQDENGRFFIREMCQAAVAAEPGEVLYIVYPWRNTILGDEHARQKVVAYRYFAPWDWIVAVGGYLDETYEDLAFENRAFAELKKQIKEKKVGRTGYIYAMDIDGNLQIHPFRESENIYDEQDNSGRYFIREIIERKQGWIRYPWKNQGDVEPRMKIARYEYFEPWKWIIAVGSYEDEFYGPATTITSRILITIAILTVLVGAVSTALVFLTADLFTEPIRRMISVMRRVRQGRIDEKMPVTSGDELGELAMSFNRMAEILKRNQDLEANLEHQGRMASLGVLSSGVAHEINNPLGVILGYAGYLEGKLDPSDPYYRYIHEIKHESRRCMKIVQDLLSYAKTPTPALVETDINEILDQIIDFAASHAVMSRVEVHKDFAVELPPVMVDGDQIRQVAINLILNAGSAMADGGRLEVKTFRGKENIITITFSDSGNGISPDDLEKVFEPFFTTKEKGTGLGLAITKQIIEAHQGSIRISSDRGRGTTVTVSLPIRQEGF